MLLTDLSLKELEILEDLTNWQVREHWRMYPRGTAAQQIRGQELTALRDKIRDAIQRRKIIKNDVPGVR